MKKKKDSQLDWKAAALLLQAQRPIAGEPGTQDGHH
jgi:hypothetical protein